MHSHKIYFAVSGNSKTLFIASVSPEEGEQTSRTLRFASQMRMLRTRPEKVTTPKDSKLKDLVARLEEEKAKHAAMIRSMRVATKVAIFDKKMMARKLSRDMEHKEMENLKTKKVFETAIAIKNSHNETNHFNRLTKKEDATSVESANLAIRKKEFINEKVAAADDEIMRLKEKLSKRDDSIMEGKILMQNKLKKRRLKSSNDRETMENVSLDELLETNTCF